MIRVLRGDLYHRLIYNNIYCTYVTNTVVIINYRFIPWFSLPLYHDKHYKLINTIDIE